MTRAGFRSLAALAVGGLVALSACGRAAEHEHADQRLTDLLSGDADTLPLNEMFPDANIVCVVDEFVSGSRVLADLRRRERAGDLRYLAAMDKVPEDMFGLLAVEDDQAELHLIDRYDVRFGLVSTQCFTREAVFRRSANGFWETDAQSF